MRIGILMGGPSREREVSFAGGRTVYDNLDKRLFTPVPLFVDSRGTIILLNWQHLYKGTLRDFYSPAAFLPAGSPYAHDLEQLEDLTPEAYEQLIAQVGRRVQPHELPTLIDFAFLTLHGAFGEDGAVQGLLQWLGIPYSGCGIYGSALGLDKRLQRTLLPGLGFASPKAVVVTWADFARQPEGVVNHIQRTVGLPCVVKHPTQGSSIGVRIAKTVNELVYALEAVAFRKTVHPTTWATMEAPEQTHWLHRLTDPREGISLPLHVQAGTETTLVRSPERLKMLLDAAQGPVHLTSLDAPDELLVEQFITGTEFSCIVLEGPDGTPIALPPTEIRKPSDLFDYRAKYLPGQASKRTPIELPDAQIRLLCAEAERQMTALGFRVYARLDGILGTDGKVYFNDPNTTSGMLPGSFFFHQAAEIGLAPGQLLTYIILRSLQVRASEHVFGSGPATLHTGLLASLAHLNAQGEKPTRVGVFLGGYSSERHVAVESGRNVVEKLASMAQYQPVPIFVLDNRRVPEPQRAALALTTEFSFWALSVAVLLKDNADDIALKIVDSLSHPQTHPVVAEIRQKAAQITGLFGGVGLEKPLHIPFDTLAQHIQLAFNTVHGRPGEDGQLQEIFQAQGIPFNGSLPGPLRLAMHKYQTNAFLKAQGIRVPGHLLVNPDHLADLAGALQAAGLTLPVIAKPADEGCSSAVKKLRTLEELRAYAQMMFRADAPWLAEAADCLRLRAGEEFPQKPEFLVEELITDQPGSRLLEVTVGLLTHRQADGTTRYEVFEPSETLAEGEILSLEEKFLAGEGQNITPARFSTDPLLQAEVSAAVRAVIEQCARLIGLEGYSRLDAFVRIHTSGPVETIFLEANTLPAMTPATCLFHQAALAGYRPAEFIDRILDYGRGR